MFNKTWKNDFDEMSWCINQTFSELYCYGNKENKNWACDVYEQLRKETDLKTMIENNKKILTEIALYCYENRIYDINKDCLYYLRDYLGLTS